MLKEYIDIVDKKKKRKKRKNIISEPSNYKIAADIGFWEHLVRSVELLKKY